VYHFFFSSPLLIYFRPRKINQLDLSETLLVFIKTMNSVIYFFCFKTQNTKLSSDPQLGSQLVVIDTSFSFLQKLPFISCHVSKSLSKLGQNLLIKTI
jgi:hypothetical protein